MTLAEQAAALLDLTLTLEQETQFDLYAHELAVWNQHTNLTAITDYDTVQVRHFLDSLTVLKAVPLSPGARVLDVGTGAGLPGLAMKIAAPQLEVVLLEATGKKVAFLQHVIDLLKLQGVTTLKARAEDAAHDPAHRAAYDLVVARAVARLPSLLEYLLPFTRIGGVSVAMKGRTAQAEADDSARALSVLGGQLKSIETFQLPGVNEPHYLVIAEKIEYTSTVYPRKPGVPTRQPL